MIRVDSSQESKYNWLLNQHIKIYLTSPITRNMQMRSTQRYCFSLFSFIRLAENASLTTFNSYVTVTILRKEILQ